MTLDVTADVLTLTPGFGSDGWVASSAALLTPLAKTPGYGSGGWVQPRGVLVDRLAVPLTLVAPKVGKVITRYAGNLVNYTQTVAVRGVAAAAAPEVLGTILPTPCSSTCDTWASATTKIVGVTLPDDTALPPAPGEPARQVGYTIKALKQFSLLMHDRPGGSEPPPYDYSPDPIESDPMVPSNKGLPGSPPTEDSAPPDQTGDPNPPPPSGGGPVLDTRKFLDTGIFKVLYSASPDGLGINSHDGRLALSVNHLGAMFNPLKVSPGYGGSPPGGWYLRNFVDDWSITFTPNDYARDNSKGKEWWVQVEAQVYDHVWSPLSGLILRTVVYHVLKPRNAAWRTSPITVANRDHGWNEAASPYSTVKGWQLSIGCEGYATNVWPIQPLGIAPAASPYGG